MRVVVAGGGIAALEALAGLRALAGDLVDATVLAPDPTFSYRPLSTAVPFTFGEQRTRSLAELADGLGARFVRDGLAQVDERRSRVLTHDGDFIPYDALLVATGARVVRGAGPGVTWARGTEGALALAGLLRELETGAVRSVAFVVPHGAAWPMDAYELSLVAALAARCGDSAAKVFLITAEERPLEGLGLVASEAVGEELSGAGVELRTGVVAWDPDAREEGGRDAFSSMVARVSGRRRRRADDRIVLHLKPGPLLTVDRVVFLPAVRGPAIAGVGHDSRGFIPIDDHTRIHDAARLYAAGDATALSLKHSTLAASQATAAAEALAAQAGAELTPTPWSPVLCGILTLPPHFPGARGSPWLDSGEPVAHCLWWPPGHVAGRHLAPYLAKLDPGIRAGLEWHPNGLPLTVPVASAPEAAPPGVPSEQAVRHDALTRQLQAIRRAEHEGEHLGTELKQRLREFEQHERKVIARLEAAGYLSHTSPTRGRGTARAER